MVEAILVDTTVTTEVPPGPLHDSNLVFSWLQDVDESSSLIPDLIPKDTDVRLRQLYRGFADNAPTEELLARVCTDIMGIKDPSSRLDLRMYVAGFEAKFMPMIAPDYRKSVQILRKMIRGQQLAAVEETPERSTKTEANPPELEDNSENQVVSTPNTTTNNDPNPEVPLGEESTLARTISAPLKSQTNELQLKKSHVPNGGEAGARQSNAERQTLYIAQKLLGTPISVEYAAQFRDFMTNFGLRLFEAARATSARRAAGATIRVIELKMYMDGASGPDIRARTGCNTPVASSIDSTRATILKYYSADQFKIAFTEYVAKGVLPAIESITGLPTERSLGRAAVADVIAVDQNVPKTPSKPIASTNYPPKSGRGVVLELAENVDLSHLFGLQEEVSWQERGLCAQTDPEAFFPDKGGSTREAKKICTGCEVRAECLEYAIEHEERFGIWGGLSERERRRLRRRAN